MDVTFYELYMSISRVARSRTLNPRTEVRILYAQGEMGYVFYLIRRECEIIAHGTGNFFAAAFSNK